MNQKTKRTLNTFALKFYDLAPLTYEREKEIVLNYLREYIKDNSYDNRQRP